MYDGYYSLGIDDMDYQTQKYKKKYEETNQELRELTDSFNEIIDALKSRSDDIDLDFNDFKFYFLKAAHSDNPAMHDQFESLMFVSKMLFGEELQAIKSEIEKNERDRLEQNKRDALLMKDYKDEVTSREQERDCIIERRKKLLVKISSSRIKFEELEGQELDDVKALLNSNNIKISIIFKRLVVINFVDIPLDFDEKYYMAIDHPGFYLANQYNFYSSVWF